MQHGSTRRIAFPARALDGRAETQTGLLHLPHRPPAAARYPVVAYGHMTTGAGPRSVPSLGTPEHPEWRRMSQGDALCDALLARGIVVLRPDYEGLRGEGGDSAGPHPYLIARSLAESIRAIVAARGDLDPLLGDDWVAAGHSEGSMAALAASVGPEPDAASRLRGTAAFAPVTRMGVSIGAARLLRMRVPGFGVLPPLIGLMLAGAATTDPELRSLIEGEGLSPAAHSRWGELAELCLTELSGPDSWGGIAPARIGGARGRELFARLAASFAENEVAALVPRRAPVRIDAGLLDEVAPNWLTRGLIRRYRRAGVELTARWWPTHHSGVMHPRFAPSEAADWIAARFPPPLAPLAPSAAPADSTAPVG